MDRPENTAAGGDTSRLEAHHRQMSQTPIPRLVVRLAIPSILSMLITSIYNIADTYFVSQLGTSAAGAVSVVFSLMAVFQAVGFTLGTGAGNILARQMGAKQADQASRSASTAVFTALVIGLLFALFGHLFIAPLMRLLGATETILPYAQAYGRYILLAAPFMCSSFVMNCLLRCEGKSSLATVGISTGGVLNILLDPIFIYVLDLKTAGAALATAVSQLVSFCILLSFFLRRKSNLRLSLGRVSRRIGDYGRIVFSGLPSLNRQGLASVSTLLLNRAAAVYGDPAVAAMGIVSKIFMFLFSAIIGFLQGYQPVAAFNYGAGQYDRVKHATRFAGLVCLVATAAIGAGFWAAAPHLVAAFRRDDAQVIAIGVFALRAQCAALPLCAVGALANFALQSTGQALGAIILSTCRQGTFFIPLILLLPRQIGLLGVQLTQTLSDIGTLLVSVPFLIYFLRLHTRKQRAAAGDGQMLSQAG